VIRRDGGFTQLSGHAQPKSRLLFNLAHDALALVSLRRSLLVDPTALVANAATREKSPGA
jgi:hypothetical protein